MIRAGDPNRNIDSRLRLLDRANPATGSREPVIRIRLFGLQSHSRTAHLLPALLPAHSHMIGAACEVCRRETGAGSDQGGTKCHADDDDRGAAARLPADTPHDLRALAN
jgi:hypothetical protein